MGCEDEPEPAVVPAAILVEPVASGATSRPRRPTAPFRATEGKPMTLEERLAAAEQELADSAANASAKPSKTYGKQ